VVPYDASHQEALLEICARPRGSIYIAAEELERDVEFNAVGRIVCPGGAASNAARVALAYRANKEEPIGARDWSYRGP